MIDNMERRFQIPGIQVLTVILVLLLIGNFILMGMYEDEHFAVEVAVTSVVQKEAGRYELSEYGEMCFYPGCADMAKYISTGRMKVESFGVKMPNKAKFIMEEEQEQEYDYGYEAYKQYGLDGDYKIGYRNTEPKLVNGAKMLNFSGMYCDEHIEEATSTLKEEIKDYKEARTSIWHKWTWMLWPYNILIILMVFSILFAVAMLAEGEKLSYDYVGYKSVFGTFVLPLIPLVAVILAEIFMEGGWGNFLVLFFGIFLNAVFIPIEAIFSKIKSLWKRKDE